MRLVSDVHILSLSLSVRVDVLCFVECAQSFSMISLMIAVLNQSIAFYAQSTERARSMKGARPHSVELQASLRAFYRSMSEFDRNHSDGKETGHSLLGAVGDDGKAQDASDEVASAQFLKGPFVNVVLQNLECIKCCIVTLPDVGRTELQLFQTLFQCLSNIPCSMHCPRLIRKIYSVIREFGISRRLV